MSRSTRICSYLLFPFIYLVVNIKLASLGKSFPISIATFLPIILLLYIESINLKKLTIALGTGAGLAAINFIFGRSLDASKYLTSLMLFVYTVLILGMTWSCRFKTISLRNHLKILRLFYSVVIIIVILAAAEMVQIIFSGSSSLIENIAGYLIYSNDYVVSFISFGGMRTTSIYFEPAFFALALISIWLSIKQFGIKNLKIDAMILLGVILSGSFSGIMTFILFYFLEWFFLYLNKKAIRRKPALAIISLVLFLSGIIFALPYISMRLGDLAVEGSSSYYRITGPLIMVGYALLNIDGMIRFGSLYEYVSSFGILNGAEVGKTLDNGLYLLIVYFSWSIMLIIIWYIWHMAKMTCAAFGNNKRFHVQLWLFIPLSMLFTGSIFSPEYAFLTMCPFIMRKAMGDTMSGGRQ